MRIIHNDNERLSRLMNKVAHGDENAFDELYSALEKPVYNLAFQITGSREDAFDVSQDTFVKLWQSAAMYAGGSVMGYALQITRNCAIDLVRRNAARPSVPLVNTSEDGEEYTVDITDSDVNSNPEAAFSRKTDIDEVRRAISMLETPHREIINLRDIDGLSYREISDFLHIDMGTVKSRLNRAREELKNILKSRNIF